MMIVSTMKACLRAAVIISLLAISGLTFLALQRRDLRYGVGCRDAYDDHPSFDIHDGDDF